VLAGFEPEQASKIKINDIPPSKRVEPHYPQIAVDNQLEGSVILRFDINKKGLTDNIEVVQSFPEGVFDISAVEALSQWEYRSSEQPNAYQAQSGKFVQLDFRLYPRD
jgi:TonB family protein